MREPQTDRSADQAKDAGKAPYRSPRLVVYGELSRITAAKGFTKGDGGSNPPSHS